MNAARRQARTASVYQLILGGELHRAKTLALKDWRRGQSHWAAAQLSMVHDAQGKHHLALKWARTAVRLMPDCPLALWMLGVSLEATGRATDGVRVWRGLLDLGRRVGSRRDDECWESRARRLSLLTDVRFRLARNLNRRGACDEGGRLLRAYLTSRARGVRSNHSVADARELLAWVRTTRAGAGQEGPLE